MKVKKLIEILSKKDPDANIAIGSTDSRWSTIGCTVSDGEWFPDKEICGRQYGDVYPKGRSTGIPVVYLIP